MTKSEQAMETMTKNYITMGTAEKGEQTINQINENFNKMRMSAAAKKRIRDHRHEVRQRFTESEIQRNHMKRLKHSRQLLDGGFLPPNFREEPQDPRLNKTSTNNKQFEFIGVKIGTEISPSDTEKKTTFSATIFIKRLRRITFSVTFTK